MNLEDFSLATRWVYQWGETAREQGRTIINNNTARETVPALSVLQVYVVLAAVERHLDISERYNIPFRLALSLLGVLEHTLRFARGQIARGCQRRFPSKH